MDTVNNVGPTDTEKILFHDPYKQCPQHPKRRIEFIYIDPQQHRYLCCNNCVLENGTKQTNFINLLDIIESEKSSVFQYWPFIEKELDQQFIGDLKQIMEIESLGSRKTEQIERFFKELQSKINHMIDEVKNKNIQRMKVQDIQELNKKIKDQYNKFSGKDELKVIVTNIDECVGKKNDSLKQFFLQKKKENKNCEKELKQLINQLKEKESKVDLEQPKEMLEFILKYIEKIDFFEEKNNDSIFTSSVSQCSKVDPSLQSNTQLIIKLINNKMNKCPDSFLKHLESKLNQCEHSFNNLPLDEEWKKYIYTKNYDQIQIDQFNILSHISDQFLLYQQNQNKMNNSTYASRITKQLSSTSDLSYVDQYKDHFENIVSVFDNKFNYMSDEFNQRIVEKFHQLRNYFNILTLPPRYKTSEDQQMFEKVKDLSQKQFKEFNYIISKLQVDQTNDQKNDLTKIQQTLSSNLNEKEQGLVFEPLLSSVKVNLSMIPEIFISLFYDEKMSTFPKNLNCSGLNDSQIKHFNLLIQKVIENKQCYTQHAIHFANQLKAYNGNQEDLLQKLLLRYPIFDLYFSKFKLFNNKVPLNFEPVMNNQVNKNLKLAITKNNYGYQQISVSKIDVLIISDILNLMQEKNYIIRMKFNKEIGENYIAFGVEELNNIDSKHKFLDDFIITTANKDQLVRNRGDMNFSNFIKFVKQVEIRVDSGQKDIYIADYPQYSHVFRLQKAFSISDKKRLVIRFGTFVEIKVNIIQCIEVDCFLVQHFDSNSFLKNN